MTLTRPQPWMTTGPDSFAHRTVKLRLPKILQHTISRLQLSSTQQQACAALATALHSGGVEPIDDAGEDVGSFNQCMKLHLGLPFLSMPWWVAEVYFYRRLLSAVGYFDRVGRVGIDPFLRDKLDEEASLHTAGARSPASMAEALWCSLWGNRVDLSYQAGRAFGDRGSDADVVIDHRHEAELAIAQANSIAVILDNAGAELHADWQLTDLLIQAGKRVTLFCKTQPTFVSDATAIDVERAAVRARLTQTLNRVEVVAHPFFTLPLMFTSGDMPLQLRTQLEAFDLVIVKGDANYRRLFQDAPWPTATPPERALSWPTHPPLLLLRTLKSEVLVGADPLLTARAQAADPEWLVNGKRGLICWVPGSAQAQENITT